MTSKPKAVLLSDVHYSLATLTLADAATRQAIAKANELQVPLVVAGDLHDTKANMRGECVKAMLATFRLATTPVYIIVGNHDLINEKSTDNSLEFLGGSCALVSHSVHVHGIGYLIPYHSDTTILTSKLAQIPEGSTVIMHQGLEGANLGDYVQDKTSISHATVKDFRVVSGHYHARQDIKTGRPRQGAIGLFSYIGNPYTLTFGEANDRPKGFQILMDDGTLEFVPTNLRKHVVIDITLQQTPIHAPLLAPNDLLWIKITGTKEQLQAVNKESTRREFEQRTGVALPAAFKLDLIPTDSDIQAPKRASLTKEALLDSLIDSIQGSSPTQKQRLKTLWRTKHG